jgi:hypothetical protein
MPAKESVEANLRTTLSPRDCSEIHVSSHDFAKSLGLILLLACAAVKGQGPSKKDHKPSPKAQAAKPASGEAGIADPQIAAAAAANLLESAYEGQRPPEAVRMLAAVLRGSQMGPGDGWFGPGESRYSWKWLVERCGVDPTKGGIARDSFSGTEGYFLRLDRNKDGSISRDDLDWSDRNPYLQASNMVGRMFRKLNTEANGRLTKEELLSFFDKAAGGKDHLSVDDFRDALLGGMFGRSKPSDAPSPPVLIRGLFAGELGSMNEGPKLNERAPDFTLKTVDGKETVQLAKMVGPKPVVLIFGSFT